MMVRDSTKTRWNRGRFSSPVKFFFAYQNSTGYLRDQCSHLQADVALFTKPHQSNWYICRRLVMGFTFNKTSCRNWLSSAFNSRKQQRGTKSSPIVVENSGEMKFAEKLQPNWSKRRHLQIFLSSAIFKFLAQSFCCWRPQRRDATESFKTLESTIALISWVPIPSLVKKSI